MARKPAPRLVTPVLKVHNPSDETSYVYWGSDTYVIGPKETVEWPRLVVTTALEHNDYKHLQIVEDEPDPTPEPVAEPWTADDWNPLEAPLSEVEAFAEINDIQADNEDDLRDLVYEVKKG